MQPGSSASPGLSAARGEARRGRAPEPPAPHSRPSGPGRRADAGRQSSPSSLQTHAGLQRRGEPAPGTRAPLGRCALRGAGGWRQRGARGRGRRKRRGPEPTWPGLPVGAALGQSLLRAGFLCASPGRGCCWDSSAERHRRNYRERSTLSG